MPKHLSRMTQLQRLFIFVVGFDEGPKIEELGKFSIEGKYFSSTFEWSVEREDFDDNDFNVLKGLQPHKNL